LTGEIIFLDEPTKSDYDSKKSLDKLKVICFKNIQKINQKWLKIKTK